MSETQAPPPDRPAPQQVADGRDHRLDPNSILAARLSGGISAAVLAGVSLVGVLVFALASGLRGAAVPLVTALWLVAITGIAVLTQLWPPLSYRHTSYRLDAKGLLIRRGVIWRSETSLPLSRVQHTDVSRGPIERSFGLATLIVHTAGTQNASVSLGGLPSDRAYLIRDVLIAEGGGDDAV